MTLARHEGLEAHARAIEIRLEEGREVELDGRTRSSKNAAQPSVARKTNETDIKLAFEVDGTGSCRDRNGCPFLNHMLDLFTKHGQFDLTVDARRRYRYR